MVRYSYLYQVHWLQERGFSRGSITYHVNMDNLMSHWCILCMHPLKQLSGQFITKEAAIIAIRECEFYINDRQQIWYGDNIFILAAIYTDDSMRPLEKCLLEPMEIK